MKNQLKLWKKVNSDHIVLHPNSVLLINAINDNVGNIYVAGTAVSKPGPSVVWCLFVFVFFFSKPSLDF